jgi:uncharacterized membrane protein YhaH (DUF805 family)
MSQQYPGQPQWEAAPAGYAFDPGFHAGPAPKPPVGFTDAIQLGFRNAFTFSGRASRSEYWWFFLATRILEILVYATVPFLFVLDDQLNPGRAAGPLVIVGVILFVALLLALWIPLLSAGVRRLHDANYSGWWILLGLVPFGGIVVLLFLCSAGIPAGARFED